MLAGEEQVWNESRDAVTKVKNLKSPEGILSITGRRTSLALLIIPSAYLVSFTSFKGRNALFY